MPETRPQLRAVAETLTAEELRAAARATAIREISAATLALDAVLELAGDAGGHEARAHEDAHTLLAAARSRLEDAARYAPAHKRRRGRL